MQCGLKSQLAYICAQLPSRLGMQLNLRLRSLYVLFLRLYVPYTYCYYSCNETHPAPGAPQGASTCSSWRPDELHGCRLCTSDARRIRDLDKSITSFYPLQLQRDYSLCSLYFSRHLPTGERQYVDRSPAIRT